MGSVGGADLQFEEAFVDVADLLDVERPEGEPPTLSSDIDVLDGRSMRSTVRSSIAGGCYPRGLAGSFGLPAMGSGRGRTGPPP